MARGAAPGVYGFDHVVVALEDFDAGVAAYSKLFPPGPRETRVNEERGERLAFFDLPNGGYIEIAAPTGPGSALRAHLDKRGPGMVLMAFQCEDLPATVAMMKGNGVHVFEADPAHTLVHPKSTHGVLMQLVEKPPGAPRRNKAGQVPDTSGVTGIVSYKCTLVYVRDIAEAVASYERLGLRLTFRHENKAAGVVQAGFFLRGGGLIELVGPADPHSDSSGFAKLMKTRGEGFEFLALDGSAGTVDALSAAGVRMRTSDPEHTDIHRDATLTRRMLLQLNPVMMGTKEQVSMGTAPSKL